MARKNGRRAGARQGAGYCKRKERYVVVLIGNMMSSVGCNTLHATGITGYLAKGAARWKSLGRALQRQSAKSSEWDLRRNGLYASGYRVGRSHEC
jgi:hypothetical protein